MGIKQFKPTTPSRRWTSVSDFAEITKSYPEKSLTIIKKGTGGRNVYGRITSRARGGGHKQKIRIIDFKRDKHDVSGKVIAIEYDPNRTARIALIEYPDSERRYILCPEGLQVNDNIMSGNDVEVKTGNSMPLSKIPLGSLLHNIELTIGKGGQLVRSAGGYAQIVAKENGYAQLRFPSGEIRMVRLECFATIGQVSNISHDTISLGKAGRSRFLGRRPKSRGVAKNPHDHPMGGGEGKSSGGRHPTTPWGKPTKGYKTRKKKKPSNRFILKRSN